MSYKNDKTTIDITSYHISHLLISENYDETNMTMMYAVLQLNKNDMDEIVKNAKTGVITLKIDKTATDDDSGTVTPTIYSGDCKYIISSDINYNKAIDYSDDAKKKDVYKDLHIGLILKSMIDNNKKIENTTIMNTTMMNAVASYFSGMKLLLEKFTYNEVITQLVVPPQDSLSKIVAFFNSVKVFYATHYRFFIGPTCAYLISSSGDGVPKDDEQYNTVTLSIKGLTETNAFVEGMSDDEAAKTYTIDIDANDSRYTIDNDTCLTTNTIESVINPNKDNDIMSSSQMQTQVAAVRKKMDEVNYKVKAQIDTIKSIPMDVRRYRIGLTGNSNNAQEDCDKFEALTKTLIQQIQNIPTQQPTPAAGTTPDPKATPIFTMDATAKQERIEQITLLLSTVKSGVASFIQLKGLMSGASNSTIGNLMGITNLPSLVNGVSPINMFSNKATMTKSFKNTLAQNLAIKNFISKGMVPKISDGNGAVVAAKAINAIAAGLGLQVPEILKTSNDMAEVIKALDSEVNSADVTLGNYKNLHLNIGNMLTGLKSSVGNISGLKINLSDQISNFKTSFTQAAKSTTQNVAEILSKTKNGIASISSTGFKFGSLKDLKNDIKKVKDISKIGQLGISSLKADLNFIKGGSGTTIIQVANDNSNYIKNVISKIQNKANRLVVNKNDLDCSVFTINKKYIVKNYDAHSNKDGKFLLSSKAHMFLREDDKFAMNTMLVFDKVADDVKSGDNAKDAKKTSNATTTTDKKFNPLASQEFAGAATDLFNTIKKSGINRDTLSTLAKEGQEVAKKYKVLKANETASVDVTKYNKYNKS